LHLVQEFASISIRADRHAKVELEVLYREFAEISMKSNPVLNEAWTRCLLSTRSAAAKSDYFKVGPKFQAKFREVLNEIAVGYSSLTSLAQRIKEKGVNKEHQINKALGGLATAHKNLMDAGVGIGRSTLSELHKELHRLKSGGVNYDYTKMLLSIKSIIESVQDDYDSDDIVVPALSPGDSEKSSAVTIEALTARQTDETLKSIVQRLDGRRPLGTRCSVEWVRFKVGHLEGSICRWVGGLSFEVPQIVRDHSAGTEPVFRLGRCQKMPKATFSPHVSGVTPEHVGNQRKPVANRATRHRPKAQRIIPKPQ
jgi:hypothetical protein